MNSIAPEYETHINTGLRDMYPNSEEVGNRLFSIEHQKEV
jgi:hypothetical protein